MVPGSTRRCTYPSQDLQATALIARAHSPAAASNAPLRASVRQQSSHGIQRSPSPSLCLGPEPPASSLTLQRPTSPYHLVPSQRQPSPLLGVRQQASPVAIHGRHSLSQPALGLSIRRPSSPPKPLPQSIPTAAVRPASTTRVQSPALPSSGRTFSPQLGPRRSSQPMVHALAEAGGNAATKPIGHQILGRCTEDLGEEACSTPEVALVADEQSSPTAPQSPSLPDLSSPDRTEFPVFQSSQPSEAPTLPAQSSSLPSAKNPEVTDASHGSHMTEASDSGDFLSDSIACAPTLLPDDVSVGSLSAHNLVCESSSLDSDAFPRAGTPKSGPVTGRLYRVACAFAGMDEGSSQLSLMTGDLVRVHSCNPSGWIYGRLEFSSSATGRRGVTGGGIVPGTSPEGAAGWFPEAILVLDDEMAPNAEDLSGHREYHGRLVTFRELQHELPKIGMSDLQMLWGKLEKNSLKVDVLCAASVEVLTASRSSTPRQRQQTESSACDAADVNAGIDAVIQGGDAAATQDLNFVAVAAAKTQKPGHRCREELAPELTLEPPTNANSNGSQHAAPMRSGSSDRWDRSVWGPPLETLRSTESSPARRRGLEEQKVRRCERRLAETARARRQCIGACEEAGRGRSEAENAIETAQRRLSDLEDQAWKCRKQVSCAASSASSSLLHNCEAKLWTVEANVKEAAKNLLAAKQRLESERTSFATVHDRLSVENQAAAAAVEALSKQRTKANLSIRCLAGASGISTSASSRGSSASPLRSHGSSRAAPALGAPPPRSGPTGRSLVRNHPSRRYLSLSPSSLRRKELERRLGLVQQYCDDGLPGQARVRERLRATPSSTSARECSSHSRDESVDSAENESAGAPPNATEAELRDMLDVLQTAEALQAKLASMPERLRTPLTKHCADLQGLIKADNSRPTEAHSEGGGN